MISGTTYQRSWLMQSFFIFVTITFLSGSMVPQYLKLLEKNAIELVADYGNETEEESEEEAREDAFINHYDHLILRPDDSNLPLSVKAFRWPSISTKVLIPPPKQG